MISPLELELRAKWRHDALRCEAEAERLAAQAAQSSPWLRIRLAGALYALALRLDPCAATTPAAGTMSS